MPEDGIFGKAFVKKENITLCGGIVVIEKLHGLIENLPDAEGNFIPGCTKKLVFGPSRYWPDYAMRCFILEPHAQAKIHSHKWPHYLLVHKGLGRMQIDGEQFMLQEGTWVFVPGDLEHGFENLSESEKLHMICIVPPEGDVNPLKTDAGA